jgi:hypothetical protein
MEGHIYAPHDLQSEGEPMSTGTAANDGRGLETVGTE